MPTVCDHLQMMSYPYFWKSLKRTKLRNNNALVSLMNVLIPSLATMHALRKKKYFARLCCLLMLTMQRSMQVTMQLYLMSALFNIAIEHCINHKRSTNILSADPAWHSRPVLNFYHPCWATRKENHSFRAGGGGSAGSNSGRGPLFVLEIRGKQIN